MHISRVVVGRQAVQDRNGDVIGYELLFRASPDAVEASSASMSSDQMTAEVVFGALNIGLHHVVDGRLILCNADRGVLVGDLPITLPPEQTVIEVLETVVIDEAVLTGCRALIAQGYRLALDDFVWFDGAEALLELATIVKIDIQAVRGAELHDLIVRCRKYDVQLLAEKVETALELEQYREMGFDLFQGYLLERPVIVSGRTLEPGHAARLRMSSVLLGGNVAFEDLEELLRADPATAYQVIQLASIGRVGETRRNIGSIREALVVAGSRRIQNWMSLILARPERADEENHFAETLIRARAVELLSSRLGPRPSSMGFAAGMLSSFDRLLGIPVDALRSSLPIDDDLAAAAFGREGELALVVRDATDYQLGVPDRHSHSGLSERDLNVAFARAFAWSMQTSAVLGA